MDDDQDADRRRLHDGGSAHGGVIGSHDSHAVTDADVVVDDEGNDDDDDGEDDRGPSPPHVLVHSHSHSHVVPTTTAASAAGRRIINVLTLNISLPRFVRLRINTATIETLAEQQQATAAGPSGEQLLEPLFSLCLQQQQHQQEEQSSSSSRSRRQLMARATTTSFPFAVACSASSS